MAAPRTPENRRVSFKSGSGDAAPAWVVSRRIFGQLVFFTLLLLSVGVGALAGLIFVYSSNLPQVTALEDYRPDVMTELYADDGTNIASFALEHRVILTYSQIPPVLFNAVVSVEDRHFESHWGVDVVRIIRAGMTDLFEWRKAQGASTLTQQLSRMFFLTREKSWRRKFEEMLLAIQIERRFTKPQIFAMYANQVPMGNGNFGFEAASQFYFGKRVGELTLPEAALLAGLQQNPTSNSPLRHPERTLLRRNQVLLAMLENHKIREAQYQEAKVAPLGLNVQRWDKDIAPYFVEEVRQFLERKYGPETVHEKGLRVYATLNLRLQHIAERALIQGLHDDDKRRGWRGAEKNILKHPTLLPSGRVATLETYTDPDWAKSFEAGERVHGLITEVRPDFAMVRFGALTVRVTPADFAWTKMTTARDLFSLGDLDLFQVKEIKGKTLRVTLDQEPDVQGAILVIDNGTGAVKAMVGGYDFNQSKYNRAVQAERQVGSSFKVYVYSQGLIDGMTPFDTVLDAPVSYSTSSGIWAPHNYDDKFEGTITLLHALAESRNVPAVRLIARIGVDKVIKLCRRFGITSRLVPNLPLALGASDLTLLEHTSAFTTFPDDGVHIEPRLVERVTNYDGAVVDEFKPEITDVLPAGVARVMVSMLREVINSGTAAKARALAAKYPLAGKTGTTNDFTDAWFIGFSPTLTCGVWVGFDNPRRSLGPKEEGSHVALPMWMDFMSEALKGQRVGAFPDSPLLTNPDQVKQILASASGPPLLAEHPAGIGASPSANADPEKARARLKPGTASGPQVEKNP
ncbi:MAG TPA: PBP1A family penicillin-binding protein [Terriglobia bacterium]|nr:PBP1A family penicillin-binding protein [Terriglobia bacterium]